MSVFDLIKKLTLFSASCKTVMTEKYSKALVMVLTAQCKWLSLLGP